jgi:enamine deaminase RidA (YjgF/YER057c/UK114 family)
MKKKQVIGSPMMLNGRELSLSKAIRAGDFVFITGQIPLRDGIPMTDGAVEPPTRSALVRDFLIDILVEIECVAYKPLLK